MERKAVRAMSYRPFQMLLQMLLLAKDNIVIIFYLNLLFLDPEFKTIIDSHCPTISPTLILAGEIHSTEQMNQHVVAPPKQSRCFRSSCVAGQKQELLWTIDPRKHYKTLHINERFVNCYKMNNLNTPTASKKTPFHRLGLTRSLKKPETESPNTSTPSKVAPSTSEPITPRPRPIKGMRSPNEDDDSDTEMVTIPALLSSSSMQEEVPVSSPITPATSSAGRRMSTAKRTRLSLSQSWKEKIVRKKELNIKRRKILQEVEHSSDSEMPVETVVELPVLETKEATDAKISSTKQKIAEIEATITVWQQGCVQALNDLQQLQGVESMESLLAMLQIPHDLVDFDSENQEFLDPD
ncbi:uncharacterized protein LOC120419891 [Culex pipiens pallens]|uniref:uncharacterized protein LOC120419891 n=1 Tax=Culex pipiens pallens TaxID=42434 RepID=UPI001954B9E3|nr:uncharacterized protein LOC120419891 [Culex pipiens pallens]